MIAIDSDKQARLAAVNELLTVISQHGRRFFYGKNGVVTQFELDARGRVWIIDSYSGCRVYAHYAGRWRGFTNGGTLRDLCEALRDYIARGTQIRPSHFGPWPQYICEGDLWGYGDGILPVRAAALRLGITETAPD